MEDKIFMQNYESFMQTENDSELNTNLASVEEEQQPIDHMTLGGMLKALKFNSLLSELDDDLALIAMGKKSVDEHKKYFETQLDPKLKKISIDYHPDKVMNEGGSKEEISQATEMQKKINAVRAILKHFNEKFSECVGFKYSFFSQVEINVLNDEKRLEQLSYSVLNKLSDISLIKYEELTPSLNGFLCSSQASMKGFSENNLGDFLQGTSNALSYFNRYLISYKKLVCKLTSLKESLKGDSQINFIHSIIEEMLKKSMIQFKMLKQLSELLNEEDPNLILTKCELFRSLDGNVQADKYFTLPFIEYINILFLCNEICLKEQVGKQKKESNMLRRFVSYVTPEIVDNFLKKGKPIYKTAPIDEEVARKVEVLQTDDFYKISSYLVTYYCHDNKKNGQLAADLLHVNEISREVAGALLVKVISIYASHLAEEFKPGKSHNDRIIDYNNQIIELLREQQEIIKSGTSKLIEAHKRAGEEVIAAMMETNKILREQNERMEEQMPIIEAALKRTEELIKKNEETVKESQEAKRKNQEATKTSREMNAKLDAILELARKSQKINGVVHKPLNMTVEEMNARLDAILRSAGRLQKEESVPQASCSKVTEHATVPDTSMDKLRLSNYNQIGK